MSPTELTIEILRSIRDEVRATNHRVDETNAQLHSLRDDVCSLRDEVHATRDGLSQRIVDSELRTATAVTDMHGTLRDLVDVLRAQHDLRPRVDRCELDITTIKERLQMG